MGQSNEKRTFQMTIEQVMQKVRGRAASQIRFANPDWKVRMRLSVKIRQANPTIAYPLRLFDCFPISDGAAAVLLVAEELAGSFQ
jgi:acetyl-CoA C-acetyltransferase